MTICLPYGKRKTNACRLPGRLDTPAWGHRREARQGPNSLQHGHQIRWLATPDNVGRRAVRPQTPQRLSNILSYQRTNQNHLVLNRPNHRIWLPFQGTASKFHHQKYRVHSTKVFVGQSTYPMLPIPFGRYPVEGGITLCSSLIETRYRIRKNTFDQTDRLPHCLRNQTTNIFECNSPTSSQSRETFL